MIAGFFLVFTPPPAKKSLHMYEHSLRKDIQYKKSYWQKQQKRLKEIVPFFYNTVISSPADGRTDGQVFFLSEKVYIFLSYLFAP